MLGALILFAMFGFFTGNTVLCFVTGFRGKEMLFISIITSFIFPRIFIEILYRNTFLNDSGKLCLKKTSIILFAKRLGKLIVAYPLVLDVLLLSLYNMSVAFTSKSAQRNKIKRQVKEIAVSTLKNLCLSV